MKIKILNEYWIALAIVALDQWTKWYVKSTMILHDTVSLIGTTVQLTYLENPGMAFGIRFFESHPFLGRWFFSIVSLVAMVFLIWYIYKMRQEKWAFRLALALILGGCVGNLIDRAMYGRVVDFMDVDIPDIFGIQRWWVFNVADSVVVVGMIIFSWFAFFQKPTPADNNKDEDMPTDAISAAKE